MALPTQEQGWAPMLAASLCFVLRWLFKLMCMELVIYCHDAIILLTVFIRRQRAVNNYWLVKNILTCLQSNKIVTRCCRDLFFFGLFW